MSDFEYPEPNELQPTELVQPIELVQQIEAAMQPIIPTVQLPHTFCVLTTEGQRQGYYLLRWSHGGTDQNNEIIHVLKADNTLNRFYNIENNITVADTSYRTIITRKNNGAVTRAIMWRYTNSRLRYQNMNIPVIKITPHSTSLPSMPARAFIPIVENQPVQQPVQEKKNYIIKTIPQHVIRALLRDAAMYEEECPITSVDIDITNGAVTSCFHLFEKTAIKHWLSLPTSNDKCPVCNTPCNSYTLEE
jgi:hypothetical protein